MKERRIVDMKGTVVTALLTASLCPLAMAQVNAPPLTEVIEQVRPSVVRIVIDYKMSIQDDVPANSPPQPNPGQASGTGFILDDLGHIGTAAHVIDTSIIEQEMVNDLKAVHRHVVPGTLHFGDISISFPMKSTQDLNGGQIFHGDIYANDFRISGARVLKEDSHLDIAVLTCGVNPTKTLGAEINGIQSFLAKAPKLHRALPADGELIAVSGFPLKIPVLVTIVGWIASSYFRDEANRSLYLGSILVNEGNSGGPAYDATDGSILGCVVQYRISQRGNNSGLTVIVPVQTFLNLLSGT